MQREKIKVYTYTRVSTAMQTDGYSLDAQKARMKAYADYNDYEIVGTYEDAGKSGKSIEGRIEFNQMMEDIKSGKDGVSFVLVFKLSRFGRNAADVLSTLQVMQDFGVNLICVEDGIDSSKDAGKLMISVLSAVAEIERENIRIQTMEGRVQKAREGKWNGGFAPYGYQLVDGQLEVNEEEAAAIRVIFDQYVHTDTGANGLAKYLENHGIRKIKRQNGKNPLFDAHLIRLILKNPVYCGKIAYGRRKTEKVHGTRNEYHLVEQDNYILADIARVFYRAGYIESWGRGIQKICDACKDLGADEPEYIVHGEDIMVKFHALQSAKVAEPKVPKHQSTTDFGALDDALVHRIIEILREELYISQDAVGEQLGTTRRVIQKKIKLLKDVGRIERVGGKRYGHWVIHD